MPEGFPDYPHHRQVLAYLLDYADHHDLRGHVQLSTQVHRATRDESGWVVTLGEGVQRRYAGLIVATGHNWHPNLPQLPGVFDGQVVHSVRYRHPDELRGRSVLVVGAGNSGCDIAVDAAIHARRAFFSVRRGYHFIPKHILGKPTDVFAHEGPRLPLWLAQPIFERLLKIVAGDPSRFGLPQPDHRLFETHPIMNTQILHHLAHGDVTAKPDVLELRGSKVAFADGSEEAVDLVVLATGYRPVIPFLDDDVYRTGDRTELFLNVFHQRFDDLFVVGLFENDGGAFPLLDRQCELIARVLKARTDDAAALSRFEARRRGRAPDFTGGVRFVKTPRMSTYVMTEPYTRYLDATLRIFGS
jgi:hypothetical protein